EKLWVQYDATEAVHNYHGPLPHSPILIDQGVDDEWLKKGQLLLDNFVNACSKASMPIQYREQAGHGHGYYFIMTFIEDHFKYHKQEFDHVK
ncbi:unnamed protein product, partial [Didymodactylos carnosus]